MFTETYVIPLAYLSMKRLTFQDTLHWSAAFKCYPYVQHEYVLKIIEKLKGSKNDTGALCIRDWVLLLDIRMTFPIRIRKQNEWSMQSIPFSISTAYRIKNRFFLVPDQYYFIISVNNLLFYQTIWPSPCLSTGKMLTSLASSGTAANVVLLSAVLLVRGAGPGSLFIVLIMSAYIDLSKERVPHVSIATRIF